MGQYGNQPDFGTRALTIVPQGNAGDVEAEPGQLLNSAALYIGIGGTLVCTVVGRGDDGSPSGDATVFTNIPNGTFFPVIVDYVWVTDDEGSNTTCSGIIALY